MLDHRYCPHGCDHGHCLPCLREENRRLKETIGGSVEREVIAELERLRRRVAELERERDALLTRPGPLRWTREVPTQEGYYWHKANPKASGLPVRIQKALHSDPLYVYISGSGTLLSSAAGWWAGPIPPPADEVPLPWAEGQCDWCLGGGGNFGEENRRARTLGSRCGKCNGSGRVEVPREPVGPAVFGCYPEGR